MSNTTNQYILGYNYTFKSRHTTSQLTKDWIKLQPGVGYPNK
jgi:hypothetical protein